MSVTWELLAGDTRRFAFKMALLSDPHDGAAATPEMAASWGAFQIWVNGRNLCAHHEQDESVHFVHWYLLPLLEWLAENWDPLFHEERPPVRNAADDAVSSLHETRFPSPAVGDDAARQAEAEWYGWWLRHSLQACRAGGLFPEVVFRRWRDMVEISWMTHDLPWAPSGFTFSVPEGTARLRPEDVAVPMYSVALASARELRNRLPGSGRLDHLVASLEGLRDPSRRQVRTAWLAGLGRESETVCGAWASVRRAVTSLADGAPDTLLEPVPADVVISEPPPAALLFGAVSPTVTDDDVRTLARLLVEAQSSQQEPRPLAQLARAEPVVGRLVTRWEQGYALADEMLDALSLRGADWIDVEGVLSTLGLDVRPVSLKDALIRGLSLAAPHRRPTIAVNTSFHWHDRLAVKRFTLAHELCHVLFDRSPSQGVAVASGPWTPRDIEQRANAFAAMFLMPTDLVRRTVSVLTYRIDSLEGVRAIAARLKTSTSATLEHLVNLGFLGEPERERLGALVLEAPTGNTS